jgi:hypothetical protein
MEKSYNFTGFDSKRQLRQELSKKEPNMKYLLGCTQNLSTADCNCPLEKQNFGRDFTHIETREIPATNFALVLIGNYPQHR